MNVKTVTYERLFPLREKFANERMTVTVELGEGDSPDEAMQLAKETVVRNSQRYIDFQVANAAEMARKRRGKARNMDEDDTELLGAFQDWEQDEFGD